MKKILILGAGGQIARFAIDLFLNLTDAQLTLYLRKAHRLKTIADNPRVRIVEGDILDAPLLQSAMVDQDVVYANLSGRMATQAKGIVKEMTAHGVKRLIFISSMGIYGEVPGERYSGVLDPYRDSAKVIEESDLDYAIVRPAWLNNRDEIDYGTTEKGEAFANPSGVVSRKSVADLVVKLAMSQDFGMRCSLGVHKTL